MNKYKCNHAVCLFKGGLLYYEDFTLFMRDDFYKLYNRFNSFSYCPICGKNLKKINEDIEKIKNDYFNRMIRNNALDLLFKRK